MSYYAANLSGLRLQAVYDLAPARVRGYLAAEIEHVLSRIRPGDLVLELGCGYGRVMWDLAGKARRVFGIDSAPGNLPLARRLSASRPRCEFALMDAARLAFSRGVFDVVVCVQNGICAFRVDPLRLVDEAVRVTRPGGRVLFSTYAERFWPHRLDWFQRQAAADLLGEVDAEATGNGVIACKDGFRSWTMREPDFQSLCGRLGLSAHLEEVDESSLFCEIEAPSGDRPAPPADGTPAGT